MSLFTVSISVMQITKSHMVATLIFGVAISKTLITTLTVNAPLL